MLTAGNGEGFVAHSARGDHDGVIVFSQLVDADVAVVGGIAAGDIAQQAQPRFVQHVVERRDYAFDARVVGGHAVADQPKGCGHLFEEVDVDVVFFVADQEVAGVDACWSCSDDCDTQAHCARSFQRLMGRLLGL